MIDFDLIRAIENLNEVRREISRINRAAGETVFNPAATQALEAVIADLRAEEGAEVLLDIEAGKY
jgi:hypothetical protein